MEKIVCIYKITSPLGFIYIGQTLDYYKRVSNHKFNHKWCNTNIAHSLKEHGVESHKFEIIHVFDADISQDRLDWMETYYVHRYIKIGHTLLNYHKKKCTRVRITQETKDKISKAQMGEKNHAYGKKMNPKAKAAIAISNTGRVASAETRKKLSIANKGKKSFLGKTHSEKWVNDAIGRLKHYYGEVGNTVIKHLKDGAIIERVHNRYCLIINDINVYEFNVAALRRLIKKGVIKSIKNEGEKKKRYIVSVLPDFITPRCNTTVY